MCLMCIVDFWDYLGTMCLDVTDWHLPTGVHAASSNTKAAISSVQVCHFVAPTEGMLLSIHLDQPTALPDSLYEVLRLSQLSSIVARPICFIRRIIIERKDYGGVLSKTARAPYVC